MRTLQIEIIDRQSYVDLVTDVNKLLREKNASDIKSVEIEPYFQSDAFKDYNIRKHHYMATIL